MALARMQLPRSAHPNGDKSTERGNATEALASGYAAAVAGIADAACPAVVRAADALLCGAVGVCAHASRIHAARCKVWRAARHEQPGSPSRLASPSRSRKLLVSTPSTQCILSEQALISLTAHACGARMSRFPTTSANPQFPNRGCNLALTELVSAYLSCWTTRLSAEGPPSRFRSAHSTSAKVHWAHASGVPPE
eukprot:351327-Chlamydomonas_euryale.AAC.7